MAQKIFAGRTKPGEGWQDDPKAAQVIYIDINTSGGNFDNCPVYVTSIAGNAEHQQLIGVTALYPPGDPANPPLLGPTNKGFRIRLNYDNPNRQLNAQVAKDGHWYINWIGVEE